jgi:hypothetical protein
MSKLSVCIASLFSCLLLWGQGSSDATIISDSDRSVEPAARLTLRPQMIDTVLPAPEVKYPFLVLMEETFFQLDEIKPAVIRHQPQLMQLYNGYAKAGGGTRLMGLGEVYYNSTRSRKMNWGVHALHLSEWGQISDYAPSMYDRSILDGFINVNERRYSYGGELNYLNQGLQYYGFQNPNASRDSIRQRFNSVGASGYYASHVKDSNALNYRVGLAYNYFTDRMPDEDTLSKWRARENFVGLRTNWQYNSSNNVLLSNMQADFNVLYNDYRYGFAGDTISALDSGLVSRNTLIQFRPVTHMYGKNEKLQFHFGLEVAFDFHDENNTSLYPLAQVSYSLFDDLFIPYAKLGGGARQQRFANLTRQNEFLNSNIGLQNMRSNDVSFGIKGTLSKRMSFNIGAAYESHRNMALFINDTVYSSGNQFRVIYDNISILKLTGSLSYQLKEELKVDGIVNYYNYSPSENPYAWNLPEFEMILRGKYNVANKLYVNLDFTLETGRRALVYNENMQNVQNDDGVLSTPLGVIADANLGVEYRYNTRTSFFMNFNNFAAQRYQRWFDYPVQAFQFMVGATFRF